MKISVSNYGVIPPKILELKNSDLKFAILLRHLSGKGVANCNVSLILSPNLVYFGPQWQKMAPEFRLNGRAAIRLSNCQAFRFLIWGAPTMRKWPWRGPRMVGHVTQKVGEIVGGRLMQRRFPFDDFLLLSGDIHNQLKREVVWNHAQISQFLGCKFFVGGTKGRAGKHRFSKESF